MNLYKAFNLRLASKINFPELMPIAADADAKADVIVEIGKVDVEAADNEAADNSNALVGKIPGIGTLSCRGGREIVIDPISGIDESLLRTAILGPALCLLLEQRGLLVLHASCINIDGQAVAFLGGSGWGKSTMVTAFHRQGYNVLTDDVMPVDIGQNRALVIPAYPQFKVAPEALTSLKEDISDLSPVYRGCRKLSYRFADGFQENPLPLRRIYVLRKGQNHEILPVNSQLAFKELICHTRTIKLLSNHNHLIAQHLQLSAAVAEKASFAYFVRKPALSDLAELMEMVKADVLELSSVPTLCC